MYPTVNKVLRKIGKIVQEDLENFGFVTIKIEDIEFERASSDKYKANVKVKGDYVS